MLLQRKKKYLKSDSQPKRIVQYQPVKNFLSFTWEINIKGEKFKRKKD